MSTYVGPSIAEVRDALEAVGRQFTTMLGTIDDPSPRAIGEWSIGETAFHTAMSAAFFLAVAQGREPPEALANVAMHNARALAEDPERDLEVLARRFEAGERSLFSYADSLDDDPLVEAFEGAIVPTSTLLGIELNEVLVHGWDIARAAGKPWPMDRRQAAIALTSVLPLLPSMVDSEAATGFTADIELRVRGDGAAVCTFRDGVLGIEAAERQQVDCRLSVDPAAYVLLAFGRVTPVSQMLRGRTMAWGRRPWLALRFPDMFITV